MCLEEDVMLRIQKMMDNILPVHNLNRNKTKGRKVEQQ